MSDYNGKTEAYGETEYAVYGQQDAAPVMYAAPKKNGKCIASMVLGIASIGCSSAAWMPISGFVSGIIGIICAAIGLWLSKTSAVACDARFARFAKAGKVTSVIGLILSIVFTVISVVFTLLMVNNGTY